MALAKDMIAKVASLEEEIANLQPLKA